MKKLFVIIVAALCVMPGQAKPKDKAAAPVKKDICIQLYSVGTLLNAPATNYDLNHERVFKALADMGYTSVETASFGGGKFYNHTPAELKADLEAAGLKALSAHSNRKLSDEEYASGDLTKALEWWKNAIPAHIEAGMKYLVCPGLGVAKDENQVKVNARYLNEIGKLCKEAGIRFGYHNHDHEFRRVGKLLPYDYYLRNTEPENVFFEMDVYWTVMGRMSPVEYFKKFPGRFELLHIKDRRELGESGMVGFDAIFKYLDIAGTKGIVVEMEKGGVPDLLASLKVCADYLLNADFVKPHYGTY